MKVNELRVGNLVFFDKEIDVVDIITLDQMCSYDGDSINLGYAPIPLTEKWLLKLGFLETDIHNDRKTWGVNSKDKFGLLYEWKLNVFTYGYIGNPTEVKYVHQLQNLYYALTGEELISK